LVVPVVGNEIFWVITTNSMDDFQSLKTFDKADGIINSVYLDN